jgi:hypothetical protein
MWWKPHRQNYSKCLLFELLTVNFSKSSKIFLSKVLTAAHCKPNEIRFEYQGVDYSAQVLTNSYYPSIESMLIKMISLLKKNKLRLFFFFKILRFTVYLGVHNKSAKDALPTRKFQSSKIIVHQEYDEATNLNDIALIKLKEEAPLNQNIQIACLPEYKGSNNVYPVKSNIDSWIVVYYYQ